MTFIPSLPNGADLRDIFAAFPRGADHLLRFHDSVMRAPSALSVAERELIAAYVSALNACSFCHSAHTKIAVAFGIAPATIEALVEDIGHAPVTPKLRVLFSYVEKLSTAPSKITQKDSKAVYDAGWSEQALHDAVSVCALFNFMNRFVSGLGVETENQEHDRSTDAYLSETYYTNIGKTLGIIDGA
jgi:uncharacterized peroxidase-related enzyme